MSNNKEERIYKDTVHLFLALQRPYKQGAGKKACIRSVIKRDEKEELKILLIYLIDMFNIKKGKYK